jgi:AraC-like DNA-binding protein
VFALLSTGQCSSQTVAKHLGIDRKTMYTRLNARGETFSSILNSVRVELARRHIRTGRKSLTETAQLLGFCGLASFSRWFRTEFGVSASRWLKEQQQRQPALSPVVGADAVDVPLTMD